MVSDRDHRAARRRALRSASSAMTERILRSSMTSPSALVGAPLVAVHRRAAEEAVAPGHLRAPLQHRAVPGGAVASAVVRVPSGAATPLAGALARGADDWRHFVRG